LLELIESTVAGLGYELVEFEKAPRGLVRVFIDFSSTLMQKKRVRSPSRIARRRRISCRTSSRSKTCL
jgi:ribosome maturation factor RimP